jgi:S1-C subfamily serine protease
VDPDEEPGRVRYPPPPDDRLWRHPSEVGTTTVAEPARPSMWVVAAVSAVSAGLLATGLVVVAIGLIEGDPAFRPIERQMVPRPAPPAASAPGSEKSGIADIVAGAKAWVVRVRQEAGAGVVAGTGVIVRSDGHVVTNAHVVGEANEVAIVLQGGREVRARVLGTDADTDTSVLKIEAEGPYPTATLGTAADVQVGERVVAVGYASGPGSEPSITVGVVSALHRSVRTQSGDMLFDMVQTDRPVPSASSGGALVDDAGSVIGITNSEPVGDGGAFGFAAPIEAVVSVADQLIDTGRVVAVWLGIKGNDIELAAVPKPEVDKGVMVDEVTGGSPAERGGLLSKDVIVGMDGRPIVSMGELVVALRNHRPGDEVAVELMRGTERRTMRVTLVERR